MANTSEFRMLTDIKSVTPEALEFNYDEIKEWLSTALEKYSGLVVTEEYIPQAKQERATLNKVQKAISDQRLAIKKEYMKPYDDFKQKCDELENMISEASSGIDSQIKEFEETKKQEKLTSLKEYFKDIASEYEVSEYADFEEILNPKWGNSTYNINTAEEEINKLLSNIKSEVEAIKNLNTPYSVSLLDFYKSCHSLAETIKKKTEFEKLEKQIRETVEENELPKDDANEEDDLTIEVLDFRVWVTTSQKKKLKQFLISNGIKYGKVD